MSNAERDQRKQKITEVFDSAIENTEVAVKLDTKFIREDRLDNLVTISRLDNGQNLIFRVLEDGVVLPVHPDGSYTIGIGNLNDEQPANAPALHERIARRIKKRFRE
jgi:hypothetical protein